VEVTPQDVATQVAAIAKRLEEIGGRLAQFDGFEGRLTAHVDKQLAAAVVDLKLQAQTNLKELKQQLGIYQEELKDQVKKGAKATALR
jgi:hypothetical protein